MANDEQTPRRSKRRRGRSSRRRKNQRGSSPAFDPGEEISVQPIRQASSKEDELPEVFIYTYTIYKNVD